MSDGIGRAHRGATVAAERAKAKWAHLSGEELAARSAWHELVGSLFAAVERFCKRRGDAHRERHVELDGVRWER